MSFRTVNPVTPINWRHPLNRDLRFWWLGLPQDSGGSEWYDLTREHRITLNNAAASVWTPTVRGDYGVDLNGTSQYLSAPHADSLDFGTGDFTVSCWWKMRDEAPSWELITKAQPTNPWPGFSLRVRGGPDWDMEFLTYNGTASGITYNAAWTWDTWYHLMGMRRGGNLYIYWMGEESAGHADVNKNVSCSNELSLAGDVADWGGSFLDGSLSDVRIWSRGLSADECREVYHDGLTGYRHTLRRRRFVPSKASAAAAAPTSHLYGPLVGCFGGAI